MTESQLILEEPLRGGQMWSRVLRRGQTLRLTDVEGGAAVAALFYNAEDVSERYNMPDTLKAQQIARLTSGFVLYSDMGPPRTGAPSSAPVAIKSCATIGTATRATTFWSSSASTISASAISWPT
jgi:uncharacterized protein YcgI (DUF1989 family)